MRVSMKAIAMRLAILPLVVTLIAALLTQSAKAQDNPAPTQSEPAQSEPAQPGPAQAVPAQVAPAQAIPAQPLPANEAPANEAAANEVPAENALVIGDFAVGVPVPIGQVEVMVGEAGDEPAMEGGEVVVQEAIMINDIAGGDGMGQQLLSKVAAENALVRRVCKLSEEQLESLKQFDAEWVKKNNKAKQREGNFAANVIRMVVPGMPADQQVQDPQKVLRVHQAELKKLLTPEQLASYEKAVADRAEFRRRANAECIVALLDERLNLSSAQRDEIGQKLVAWNGLSNIQPYFYFQNTSYFPSLPADVKKVLNASQRKAMQMMNEADIQFSMFGDGEEAVVIDR